MNIPDPLQPSSKLSHTVKKMFTARGIYSAFTPVGANRLMKLWQDYLCSYKDCGMV